MSAIVRDATAEGYANPTANKAFRRMTAGEYRDKIEREMSEHQHQTTLFDAMAELIPRYPELELLHAIPNGGYRPIKTAGDLKAAGVKAGVPDMCLPVARGGYHALYIELKAHRKGARTSIEQNRWIDALRCNGYRAVVCYGWRDARDEILRYLGLSDV